jgi:hypothetical protein
MDAAAQTATDSPLGSRREREEEEKKKRKKKEWPGLDLDEAGLCGRGAGFVVWS